MGRVTSMEIDRRVKSMAIGVEGHKHGHKNGD